MLYQIHHVNAEGEHDFVAQREFDQQRTPAEFQAWCTDVRTGHQLPEKSIWWICTEEAPEFFMMAVS